MTTHDTLYIAEPLFSKKLLEFDPEATFPPIKKIGITSGHPKRRDRELGTKSPVKVAIVKAWTGVDAKKAESSLHRLLRYTRLEGEYFWDGDDELTDDVTDFMEKYHPEAREVAISNDRDVKAAATAKKVSNSKRIKEEVIPELDKRSIAYEIMRNGNRVRFNLGEYGLSLGCRAGGK